MPLPARFAIVHLTGAAIPAAVSTAPKANFAPRAVIRWRSSQPLHLSLGEVTQAEKNLIEILSFCKTSGCEYIETSANALSSVVAVAKGNVAAGVKAINTLE